MKQKFSPEDKRDWWNSQLSSGHKTFSEFKRWLKKSESNLTVYERVLFVFFVEEPKQAVLPWDAWRK